MAVIDVFSTIVSFCLFEKLELLKVHTLFAYYIFDDNNNFSFLLGELFIHPRTVKDFQYWLLFKNIFQERLEDNLKAPG